VDNFSPVDYLLRKNEDGSASILLGSLNLTNNVRYLVTITLRPNSSRIETEIRTFNTDLVPQRYYFWSNAGIPTSENLRIFYPGYHTNHGSFPVNEQGVDLSWYRNYLRPASLFMLDSEEDFFAAYNYDVDIGVVHVADHNIVPGKKFFTWGTSESGLFWADLLSDRGIPYIEIQSGRFLTQGIVEFINPLTFEAWTEHWYPVRNLGGITYANENASLYVEKIAEGRVKVKICPAITCEDARLEIKEGQKTVHEEKLQLSPSDLIVKEVDVPKRAPLLRIVDSEGKEIVSWNFRKYKTKFPEVPSWRGEEEDWKWRDSSEELWLKGMDAAKKGPLLIAKRYFERSLEKDGGFSKSLTSLGLISYLSGLYGEAEEFLRRALKRDPYSEEARNYLCLTLLALGDYEDAERNLWKLYTVARMRTLAFFLLGIVKARLSEYEDAEEMFRRAIEENGHNLRAITMLSAVLRKEGKREEALAVIERGYDLMPLDYMVLAERHFLSSDKGFEMVFTDYQKVLEVAKDYIFAGLYEDAIAILKEALNRGIRNPLIYYYVGYALKKMGKVEEAIEYYRNGGKEEVEYVFPHRLLEIDILEDVVKTIPESPVPHYLLGNVLYYRNRQEEGLEKWEKASELGLEYAILYRNLGATYNALTNEGDKAIEAYKRAISLSPENYVLYVELDDVYSRLGLFKERVDLLEDAPRGVRKDRLIAKLGSAYIDVGEVDKALDILLNTFFEPMEAYYGFWEIYVDALMAKGLRLLKENRAKEALKYFIDATKYPKNLGVGAPHPKYRNDVMQLYYAGLAYEKLGDKANAERMWNDALQRSPGLTSEHCIFKALILRKTGREKEAEELIEKIINEAQSRMDELHERVGDECGVLSRLFSSAGAASVPGYRSYLNTFAYLHYVKGLASMVDGRKEEGLRELNRSLELTKTIRHARWAKEGTLFF
jgi:tetratricopeptide (TPR) repeat protein